MIHTRHAFPLTTDGFSSVDEIVVTQEMVLSDLEIDWDGLKATRRPNHRESLVFFFGFSGSSFHSLIGHATEIAPERVTRTGTRPYPVSICQGQRLPR